jgi:hypothetical protein
MTPFAFSRAAHRHASCFCYAEPPQSIVPRSPIVAATIAAAVMGAHGRHSIARDDSSVRHRPTGCSGRSFYEPGTAAGWRFSSSGRRPSGHAGTVRQCSRSTLGTLRDATTFARNPPLADLCSRTPLLSVRAVTASHRGRVNIPNVSPAPAEASRQRGRISGGWRFKKPPTSDQRRSHNFHRRRHFTDIALPERGYSRADLGTLMRGRLCRSAANGVVFRRILEAPPGFEPGMEVLQTVQGCDS